MLKFDMILNRILDTNRVSDMKEIKAILRKIKGNVLCVGVGGSKVVSEYASKVFNFKNNCLTINREPRDLLYENIDNIDGVFVCSYSGKNYGVKIALTNNKTKYLFTNGHIDVADVNLIKYQNSLAREKSFISLSATLMPMSILLNYYLDNQNIENLIKEMFENIEDFNFENNEVFEIISGSDTSVASNFLESTLTEAGLGVPIIHSKYNYCHGRTTLAHHTKNHTLIYLMTSRRKLDKLILSEVQSLYKGIIILSSNYNDIIIDNFNLTLKAMAFTSKLAEIQNKSLNRVDYAQAVKKLYCYKGEM